MSKRNAEPTWSEIASWYDDLLDRGSGPHETAVASMLRMTPDLAGAEVLDIACGQGLATRALSHAGARTVVGIDATEPMIELARMRTGSTHAIRYAVDDAQRLASCADSAFDGVTCQLGLMDIPDLGATLQSVYRVLKPGGWFVFVIGHPCFLAPEAATMPAPDGRSGRFVTDYFSERFWRSADPSGVRRAGNYHRTLTTYLNGLVSSGFHLEIVDEPRASPLLSQQQSVYDQVPIFFGARTRRPSK